jgi:hypothetical protein
MLDSNGNQIARIGRYGNADSPSTGSGSRAEPRDAGPGNVVPEPEIAFAWPAFVSTAREKVFVSDSVNCRVTVVRLDHAAEATVDLK